MAGAPGRRSRAAEVGGRVLPAADARAVHDAGAHVQRADQCRADPDHRRDQPGVRPGIRRHHDAAADAVARLRDRTGARNLAAARRGRPRVDPDRHGQHPQRRRVCGCRPDAARALRRVAGRARVHRVVHAQQGVHQPSAQVQRRHHGLHRELHARRIAGSRARAGDRPHRRRRHTRLQYPGRRQDGLGRLSGGAAVERVRPAGRRRRGVR